MDIRIYKGYVTASRQAPGYDGLGTLRFSIGDPVEHFYSLFASWPGPFAGGGHMAVAATASWLPGMGKLALAYRRPGPSQTAHAINMIFPLLCITIAVLSGALAFTFTSMDAGDTGFLLATSAAGLFGLWRLWATARAKRLLNQLTDLDP